MLPLILGGKPEDGLDLAQGRIVQGTIDVEQIDLGLLVVLGIPNMHPAVAHEEEGGHRLLGSEIRGGGQQPSQGE